MFKKVRLTEIMEYVAAAFATMSGWSIFILMRHDPPFVDETVLNIPAAKNFFLHGNYTYPDWGDFSPIISTGLWSSFPSGIAAAFFNASLGKIRFVSYLFSNILIFLACWLALRLFSKLESSRRISWAFIITGLFFTLIPYPNGAFMTLGEIPAGGYLGIGLALITAASFWGAFFMGVAVFGGKMVNIVFTAPLILTFVLSRRELSKNKIQKVAGYCAPVLLWILIIFACIGLTRTTAWFGLYRDMLVQFVTVAKGTKAVTYHVPFLKRFSNPGLEWAGYPFTLKIKMLVLLFLPPILIIRSFWREHHLGVRNWIEKNPLLPTLLVGFAIFDFWYFCIHPYMWIRHVQPALIAGFGYLSWRLFNGYLSRTIFVQRSVLCFVIAVSMIKIVRILV